MKNVRYQDLINTKVNASTEKLIQLDPEVIRNEYNPLLDDMKKISKHIFVRKTVYRLLVKAQLFLQKKDPNLSLLVTYGYRSSEIQKKYFLRELKRNDKFYQNPLDLYEFVHTFIAVPTVAGHPTGGAVDVIIVDRNQKSLNFGGDLYGFKQGLCPTFSKGITKNQIANRLLLRKCMMKVGFAPFDEEWWHFSFGDKEWAFYYNKPAALYEQLEENEAKKFML